MLFRFLAILVTSLRSRQSFGKTFSKLPNTKQSLGGKNSTWVSSKTFSLFRSFCSRFLQSILKQLEMFIVSASFVWRKYWQSVVSGSFFLRWKFAGDWASMLVFMLTINLRINKLSLFNHRREKIWKTNLWKWEWSLRLGKIVCAWSRINNSELSREKKPSRYFDTYCGWIFRDCNQKEFILR